MQDVTFNESTERKLTDGTWVKLPWHELTVNIMKKIHRQWLVLNTLLLCLFGVPATDKVYLRNRSAETILRAATLR